MPDKYDHIAIGFNRANFVHEIFEPKYNADVNACAEDLGIRPNYLRDIIFSSRNAGTKTLSSIYRYCLRHKMDPTRYIFVWLDQAEMDHIGD